MFLEFRFIALFVNNKHMCLDIMLRIETTIVLESGYFPSQFVKTEVRGEKEMKIQAEWNMRGKGHF